MTLPQRPRTITKEQFDIVNDVFTKVIHRKITAADVTDEQREAVRIATSIASLDYMTDFIMERLPDANWKA